MKRQYILISAICWLALVSASASWNIEQIWAAHQRADLQVARSFFELIVTVREWNAQHGGVYVPVSDLIQPNPYLHVPDRDISLPNGVTLTKVNPAYMTRLISELTQKGGNQIRFHITSLNPLNPGNAANPWETQALTSFEAKALGEAYGWDGQAQIFTYMAPLITQQSCLKCHADQGYKVGDIRGGISVTFNIQPIMIWPVLLSHLLIGLVGLGAIIVFGRQLTQAFADLERQSQFDGLTQLHNRSYFDMYLHREFLRSRRQQQPLSIILCDVDYFKSYNDIYGHQPGDSCLRRIANALTETLKRPGDLVARYGGEEFVIVLPDTHAEGALAIAEQVRAKIESLGIEHNGSKVSRYVTLSLGVAISGGDLREEILLKRADQCLYRAKQAGRNMVVGVVPALTI
ncbi:MAG: diguanylate cyclase [Chloroflexales bacterium]